MARIFALIGFASAFFIDFNLRWFPFSVFYFGIFVIWRMKNLTLSELERLDKYFNNLCSLLQILGIFIIVAVFLDILKMFDYAYQIFAICSTTITFYTLGASIRLFWIMQAQGKESKTPETLDFKDLLKKQKQMAEAINSIHKVLSSTKDNNIIIYSKDLLDELYFQRKIIENIIKNLEKGIKIVFLFNEENEANKSIREFLDSYKDDKNLFYSQIKQEIPVDFIVSDKQYLRIEFDRETHTARFLDTIKNKDESEEANRWINITFAILTNNIIKTLEEEGKLEQANKLKENQHNLFLRVIWKK